MLLPEFGCTILSQVRLLFIFGPSLRASSFNPMPICIECRYPVNSLYTEYSKADDRSLGKGVRLTQCPHCRRFADKYVEHDFVVLFIDLVLIKPQVCVTRGCFIESRANKVFLRRFTDICCSIDLGGTTIDSMYEYHLTPKLMETKRLTQSHSRLSSGSAPSSSFSTSTSPGLVLKRPALLHRPTTQRVLSAAIPYCYNTFSFSYTVFSAPYPSTCRFASYALPPHLPGFAASPRCRTILNLRRCPPHS
jgi:Arv1-like family